MDYQIFRNKLKNIQGWVFDLDDTLYPPTGEIYAQMAERICAYVMKTLHIDKKEASVIQKEYYRKYGATVRGLMIEYDIDPEDFTNYVHQLDLSSLKENPQLKACLQALSGKKFIFTNGAYQHAERVLEQLGIRECFSGIFSIREAGYIPKPAEETYRKMLETFQLNPQESIMFDDSPANVLGAKKVGMHTVWISSNVENNKYCSVDSQDFCDYETPDLISFLTAFLMDKSA
ncbi:MAG: pyrimidine 5'-nucleotidase [Alphaproteobacteria bacterium]|nr:pyrimidine 5'-nucleotidase [Alphaproteobacteria bacterium]